MAEKHRYLDSWDRKLQRVLEEDPFKRPAGGSEGDERLDPNIVTRQIIAQVIRDREWSQNHAAKRMGLHQRSLGRFMNGDGWTLSSLGDAIVGLDTDIVAFFQSHPVVTGSRAKHIHKVRNVIIDRFRTVLRPAERKELVYMIEQASDLGVYERAITAFRGAVETARSVSRQRRTIRKR